MPCRVLVESRFCSGSGSIIKPPQQKRPSTAAPALMDCQSSSGNTKTQIKCLLGTGLGWAPSQSNEMTKRCEHRAHSHHSFLWGSNWAVKALSSLNSTCICWHVMCTSSSLRSSEVQVCLCQLLFRREVAPPCLCALVGAAGERKSHGELGFSNTRAKQFQTCHSCFWIDALPEIKLSLKVSLLFGSCWYRLNKLCG